MRVSVAFGKFRPDDFAACKADRRCVCGYASLVDAKCALQPGDLEDA